VRVILTMRSEFLGECARLPGFAAVVNTTQYLLPRMETASLQRAIRRPAELYDGNVTHELAERLIADVQDSQDELPLIQHGLMRMWDLAGGADMQGPRRLDLPLYETHGPLVRLLDRHAEAVAVAAAPDVSGRRVVEDAFRSLTEINADGQAVRRPQSVQSLIAVTGGERGRLMSILDAFRSDGVSFVTPYAPVGLDDEKMIDVSHEALIRCWNSLAAAPDGWLHREFRDGLIWRSLLTQAELFEKDPRNVLGSATTQDRESWLKRHTQAWSERYGGGWSRVKRLIRASRKAETRRRFSFLALALALGLAVIFVIQYWLQIQPWAYLSDLIEGGSYDLRGPAIMIGRNTSEIRNFVDIPYDTVSRIQMIAFKSGQALDARSLNGTIVNGRFLRYGSDYYLQDKDIVAFAGVSAFQVSLTGPFAPAPQSAQLLSPHAWGVLIDGHLRTTTPITKIERLFLESSGNGSVILSERETRSSVVEVEPDDHRLFSLINKSLSHSLFAMFKFEDRKYLSLQVPFGNAVRDRLDEFARRLDVTPAGAADGARPKGEPVRGTEYFSKMSFCLGPPKILSLDLSTLHKRISGFFDGLAEIQGDDEPSCVVGPFQIVVVPGRPTRAH
jgi:FHA domain